MVEWRLRCDVPKCEAELVAHGRDDDQALRRLRVEARAHGWDLGDFADRCRHHRSSS